MTQKVAIFGGSFNPPHLGHLGMIATVLNMSDVGHVYVAPCFQQAGKDLISFEHRLEMCRLAFADLPATSVNAVERDLGGESYTYRLVEHLQATAVNAKFLLVLGSDLVDKVPSWKNWSSVTVPVRYVQRKGPSSTIIRDGIRLHNDFARRNIPRSVGDYIGRNGLYT